MLDVAFRGRRGRDHKGVQRDQNAPRVRTDNMKGFDLCLGESYVDERADEKLLHCTRIRVCRLWNKWTIPVPALLSSELESE